MQIPHARRDRASFGRELAERVAAQLDQGHQLVLAHRDSCGMGLALIEGHYCYAEVNNGHLPPLDEIRKRNSQGSKAFADRYSFVDWLASQSDHSLSRLAQEMHSHDLNQTNDRARLIDFVQFHEQAPLLTLQRWTQLWRAIPAEGDPSDWFQTIYSCYGEPHRAYHNRQHLSECLTELDAVIAQAQNPVSLEVALWFHDVVYDPALHNNEDLSAIWAAECLEEGKVARAFIDQVISLILLTRTHIPDNSPDAALMCDIDLAILGQNESRYAEYEAGIRKEYSTVPIRNYAQKRAELLQIYLQRPVIYQTKHFYDRFEIQARFNLNQAISKLSVLA